MRRITIELTDAQTELLYQVVNGYYFEQELCTNIAIQDAAQEFDDEGTYNKLSDISWVIHTAIDRARK